MKDIEMPRTTTNPIKEPDGYWLSKWYQSVTSSREGSNNSPASEKILNYVSEALQNIVNGLNNNFSKISDRLKEIRSEIQGAHRKIIDNRKKDEERHDQLLSRIEATNRKVDRLQDSLKDNEQKLDKIIQQLSAWTTSIQFEEKTFTIRTPTAAQRKA